MEDNLYEKNNSQYPYVRMGYRIFTLLKQQFGFNLYKLLSNSIIFIKEYITYVKEHNNTHFKVSMCYLYPCLTDRTKITPIEPIYFFQDTWTAHKIFQIKPEHHYDVGSSVKTMGIISQFVPTTIIDIRPIELELKNLFFKEGSILGLPLKDNFIDSLSSLCVIEHIGLGRYGDPVDSWGSEKAIKELKRVLKPGGNLLISVPIDEECRVYFNAHRAFTREYLLELFQGLDLREEKYIYGRVVFDKYYKSKGFGTGLYHFRKTII